MSRDPRVENWLTSMGLKFTYEARVGLDRFDAKRSIQLQPRYERLNQDTVDDYALAMMDGADFPASIAYDSPTGYIYISGNHRHAGAILAARESTDCYLVQTDGDTYLQEILISSANKIEANEGLGREQRMLLAMDTLRRYPQRTIAEVSKLFTINKDSLGTAIRAEAMRTRLAKYGEPAEMFSPSHLLELSPVQDDEVAVALAAISRKAKLTSGELHELRSDVLQNTTKEKQISSINEFANSVEVQSRIPRSSVESSKSTNIRRQLFKLLSNLQKYMKGKRTLADMELTKPTDWSQVIGLADPMIYNLTRIRNEAKQKLGQLSPQLPGRP